jgi:hypothetical protein
MKGCSAIMIKLLIMKHDAKKTNGCVIGEAFKEVGEVKWINNINF